MKIMKQSLIDECFVDVPITVLCPYCKKDVGDDVFDFSNDANNSAVDWCPSCERYYGIRVRLTTTVDYFNCDLLDLEDEKGKP